MIKINNISDKYFMILIKYLKLLLVSTFFNSFYTSLTPGSISREGYQCQQNYFNKLYEL
jgi:hypothetical protein